MGTNFVTQIFVILTLAVSFTARQLPATELPPLIAAQKSPRRILHQPLFSVPPPAPAPPPPPPALPATPDHPFFPQSPPSSAGNGTSEGNPAATPPAKPVKKVAIAISVGIVTLGMLSALAFYLYRHRARLPGDTQKLVAGGSQRLHDESRRVTQPSDLLYIGTVKPSVRSAAVEPQGEHVSPYRKLSSPKLSERYRPSPELQPLPRLSRPPVLARDSPPSTPSFSDEESHKTTFYTPQCSSVSNEDGSFTPGSRCSHPVRVAHPGLVTSFPRSKRTSPKQSIIPPVKQRYPAPPPAQAQSRYSEPTDLYSPTRPRFSSPPPPPDMARLQSITSRAVPTSYIRAPPAVEKTKTVEEFKTFGRDPDTTDEEDDGGSKRKLEPLNQAMVGTASDRVNAGDQQRSTSFEPPEAKKLENIATLLRAHKVTWDQVAESLLEGNPEGLSGELLDTLVKMAPTKEEKQKLRDFRGDISQLRSTERFMKMLLDIPFSFKRVEALLYRTNFDMQMNYLRKSFQTLEAASAELKNSRLFLRLTEGVLRAGNRMNIGTSRGDDRAFKLDTLLKLADIKGTDGKTTLLHFAVQEIIRLEDASDHTTENIPNKLEFEAENDFSKQKRLQFIASLNRELGNVKEAAEVDWDVLRSHVIKLEIGLEKVKGALKHEKSNMQGKFFESMRKFLNEAEYEIQRIKADERRTLSLVQDLTEYFHGYSAKEEAHPLRVFMEVRYFLLKLDCICKENIIPGSSRIFQRPPVLDRYKDSSDEQSSSP
ncbi:hypothetical protein NMG60_11025961 [Bertholletia excelsa]